MVKEMTAQLFHEQRELVERLNAMQRRIEEDKNEASKVLLQIEWKEEKKRSVDLLNTVQIPFNPSHRLPNREHPAAAAVGMCGPQMTQTYPAHLRADRCVSTRRARGGCRDAAI